MGKFAISCPNCGRYVTAYNGLAGLIHNKITCSGCNYEIDVKSNRMTSVVCPNCNNMVIYDQGKKVPQCPVCKHEIKAATGQKMVTIHCPTCHTAYSMVEGAEKYTCPLCDSVIDVRKELAAIQANAGMTSLIEYDPGDKDWLVYKHPIKNFSNGSQLIVRPGQQALLIEAGEDSHLFQKGTYTMDTANMPWMEKAYKLPDGDTKATLQSSIYFFNTRTITGDALQWFVKKTPVIFTMRFDGSSRANHVTFNVGCGGTYDIHITDARKLFLNLNSVAPGMNVETLAESGYSDATGSLSKSIKRKINGWGGEILASVFRAMEVGIFELDTKRSQIGNQIRERVNSYLNEFGLEIQEFVLDSFATPEDDPSDPGYKDFRNLRTIASSAAVSQATEIHEQDIEEQRRLTQRQKLQTARESLGFDEINAQRKLILAEAEAKGKEMQYAAEAAGLKMKGGNYAMETARVGLEALAQGGANGGSGGGLLGAGSGELGELARLGVGLGAIKSIVGLTRDTFNPVAGDVGQMGNAVSKLTQPGWNCTCGQTGIMGNFCPNCGAKQPEVAAPDAWDCPDCGAKGITSKFCPNCGAKRPEKKAPDTWICPDCGTKDITSKFCPNCGAKRPEKAAPDTWDCPECGTKGITTGFCPNCGAKKTMKKENET